jgi:hypothetical protein
VGVGIRRATARLGHSGISISGDLFEHVAADTDKEVAERAAAAFGRVESEPGPRTLRRRGVWEAPNIGRVFAF